MAEPKVRFKRDDGSSFPTWKEYSISDLFTKIGNKNKDGQNTNVITNSAEFGLIPQRDYFDKDIAVEGNTGNYTIIQTGDFVYNPRKSSYAPMGPFNCYRLEKDGIVSPLYSCLRPKGVLNPEYLLWYFQTDKWYGYVNDHGAQNGARHDRVGMTDKILMGIPVTAPCEEEQQKIADFLSSVDEVIFTSEQEVANLETQKKAVMKKIFSQEVRFKRADGNSFPEWEEQTLGNLAEFSKGQGYTKSDLSETGCPIILYGRLYTKYRTVITEVDTFAEMKPRSVLSKKGDVIVPGSGETAEDISVASVVNVDGIILGGDLNIIHPCDAILPDYLAYALTFGTPHQEMAKRAQGKSIVHLHNDDLKAAVIIYPCLEEQRLIADFISDFDEAIAAAKKELELWKELKKGLLQQMFV